MENIYRVFLIASMVVFFPHSLISEDRGINEFTKQLSANSVYKINNNDSLKLNRILVTPGYEILHSTHGDYFTGISVIGSYNVVRSFYLGLGTEFSYSKFHNDNGWLLYNLKFFPIFLDAKLNLKRHKMFCPFLNISEGISFIKYRIDYNPDIGKIVNVSETGQYFFAGVGCHIRINKYFSSTISLGFKGFNMSLNNLDVNPHGWSLRIGCIL
jgi:hypothetical protein